MTHPLKTRLIVSLLAAARALETAGDFQTARQVASQGLRACGPRERSLVAEFVSMGGAIT